MFVIKYLFLTSCALIGWFDIFSIDLTAQQSLEDERRSDKNSAKKETTSSNPTINEPQVQILSDKVYLYRNFDVLFQTPFRLEETVRIRTAQNSAPAETKGVSQAESQIIREPQVSPSTLWRNEKQEYSNYSTDDGQTRRAIILGFYTSKAGLHSLPRIRFESADSGQSWQSPELMFAAFQKDEEALPLPLGLILNILPQKVYLGQNILLNVWAERVSAIDQSRLKQPPEFSGFLVQKSPIQPEVERYEILGHDVYSLPLVTWLLNPIKEGALSIPAISAEVMGLERKTSPQALEVLPLPPKPNFNVAGARHAKNGSTQPTAIAIGQFELWFGFSKDNSLQANNSNNPTKTPQTAHTKAKQEFAKDELIHITLRLSGSGNIHLVNFPKVITPNGLVPLQNEETESLELDFGKAELSGWREKKLVYKAKSSGKYSVAVSDFYFFDPKQSRWQRIKPQDLSLQVVNFATQSYYFNLEDLHFSPLTVFFVNTLFWLQKYAFYICFAIFLLIGIYFLVATNLKKQQRSPFPQKRVPKRHTLGQYRQVLPLACVATLVLLLHSISDVSSIWETKRTSSKTQRYYLEQLRQNALGRNELGNVAPQNFEKEKSPLQNLFNSPKNLLIDNLLPGNLLNTALQFYQNGRVLQALELAYLSYSLMPLHPVSHRLIASLRVQQGLEPKLPDFFVWPLQLNYFWKVLVVSLFFIALIYCVIQSRQKPAEPVPYYYDSAHSLAARRQPHSYRNYWVAVFLLLASLCIPWRFSLAVNTRADLMLAAIPYREAASGEAALLGDKTVEQHESWNNRLRLGELVKIKGYASNSPYALVIGEKQDQGWLDTKTLFLLHHY